MYYYLGLKDLSNETPNADLGVQYSAVNGGSWMPYYLLNQNGKTYMIYGGNAQVDCDHYDMKPNENGSVVFSNKKPLTMTVYKNVKAIVDGASGNVVRLSFRGSDGNNSGKSCQYIAEGGTGITKSVKYRVLATINRADLTTVPSNTWIGMTCNYTDVNVDGIAVKWSGTPEAYMGTLTDTSPGKLIGSVNMK